MSNLRSSSIRAENQEIAIKISGNNNDLDKRKFVVTIQYLLKNNNKVKYLVYNPTMDNSSSHYPFITNVAFEELENEPDYDNPEHKKYFFEKTYVPHYSHESTGHYDRYYEAFTFTPILNYQKNDYFRICNIHVTIDGKELIICVLNPKGKVKEVFSELLIINNIFPIANMATVTLPANRVSIPIPTSQPPRPTSQPIRNSASEINDWR